MISGNLAARSGCMTGDSTKRNCASVPSGSGREMRASEEASGCADSFGALPSSGWSRECWRWKRRKACGRTQASDADPVSEALFDALPQVGSLKALRLSRVGQPERSDEERGPRTALICVCGYCSIQSGAGRLWTNKWAAQRAGRATKPIRATLFLTLLISARRGESQPERTRTRRPRGLRKASRGRPGVGGAACPGEPRGWAILVVRDVFPTACLAGGRRSSSQTDQASASASTSAMCRARTGARCSI